MHFQHSADVRRDFPQLDAGVLLATGITASAGDGGNGEDGGNAGIDDRLDAFHTTARERLAVGSESDLPEIQAWRRTFAAMGLKPTQYRCASEALLRRFRKEGTLPRLHPLIDLCNAVSVATAIPIAVFDLMQISGDLEVRYAQGDETYRTFGGEVENPAPGEVIFADGDGQAHARRWTNRQSGASAVRDGTSTVLIVAEAMHESPADIAKLIETLATEITAAWPDGVVTASILSAGEPRFEFQA